MFIGWGNSHHPDGITLIYRLEKGKYILDIIYIYIYITYIAFEVQVIDKWTETELQVKKSQNKLEYILTTFQDWPFYCTFQLYSCSWLVVRNILYIVLLYCRHLSVHAMDDVCITGVVIKCLGLKRTKHNLA